jgi:peroxiredoxin
LADKDKAVTEAFGVKNLIGMASRSAFLFKDGVCVWVDPKGSTSDQAEQVLTALKTQKH